MPRLFKLPTSRHPNAADYNRLVDAAIWGSTDVSDPSSPVRGQVRLRDDATVGALGLEVYVGATTGWQLPWSLPWGYVGSASVNTDQSGITALVDVTSASVTFTALANRRYRVTGVAQCKTTNANDHVDIRVTNGAGTVLSGGLVRIECINTTRYYGATIVGYNAPAAGSVTFKMRALVASGAGSLTIGGASVIPTTILVEDIGPAGAPPAS